MEQNPLISVIVPVYKVEEYLSRCVDSLLNQTYENLQVILVDDGSPDNSGTICDAYAGQDSRVKVIHKVNGGLSSARNAGIDAAQGDYLSFVDSDDWLEPDSYEHMMAAALQHDVKLVCAGRYDVNSETGVRKLGLCPPRDEVISGTELARRIFVWDNIDSAACDKLYHRSLFRQIRYPLGVVSEDVPTTYRIALDAGNVAMCAKPIYNYFHRAGSISTAAVSEKTFHFSQHTAKIYPYIRENYPEIADAARYQRVRSLTYNLLSLDLAGEQSRKDFASQYADSRKELSSHLFFVMKSPMFKKQEKLTNLLLALGCYRYLRKVYHAVKPGKN